MAILHNRVSNKELKERLMQETFKRITISFYRYFPIQNPQEFRDQLYKLYNAISVFGRVYVAKEGINAQISVPEHHIDEFKSIMESIPGLENRTKFCTRIKLNFNFKIVPEKNKSERKNSSGWD